MIIIATLLLIVLIIVSVMIVLVMSRHDNHQDIDSQYYDENGDHIYYDRSLKKKKEYSRRNPSEVSRLRTLRALFFHK